MRTAIMITTALALLATAPQAQAASFTPPRLTLVAGGFTQPIAFVQDPSSASRQVVVEQTGHVRLLVNSVVQPSDYLDLSGVVLAQGEQGLLGFAFAPDYATSGRLYVNFINQSGNTVIARFTRAAGDPLHADPASRFDFVWPNGNAYITQPYSNHNGGNLAFGPGGFLYIGMGDGGSSDDPQHNAQNPASLLGKMLRLDVSVATNDPQGYDVPAGNPFVGQGGVLAEIWSFGLRNPWRWGFDDPGRGGTGALVIADVGQGGWEEIDYEPAGAGGRNYGWRNREGAHAYIGTLPPFSTPLTEPIYEYSHAEGRSITGGAVYRGTALGAGFTGRYVFADFPVGRIWSVALTIDSGTGEATVSDLFDHTDTLGTGTRLWSSFGVDADGELHVLDYGGQLLRFEAGTGVTPAGAELVQNGALTHGTLNWRQFATPDQSYIVSNVTNGVLQFYRQAAAGNQATVFQETGAALTAAAPISARFDLGNSSSVRKRISVLLLDADFTDLSVCTFWLPANAPMRTYRMTSHTTKAWSNASIYFYAATTGSDGGFYRLDNVSMQYAPSESAARTNCVDPTVPAAPGGGGTTNLLLNGDFGAGLGSWSEFGQITSQVASGVYEFVRPAGTPAGVVFQPTAHTMTSGQIMTADFALGNSSGVRKRVTVLLHDLDFTDLAACTFWLPPGQGLSAFTMRTYATRAWANATLSVYPSTVGLDPWIRLDDVSVRRTPATTIVGTECVEPGAARDADSGLSLTRPAIATASAVRHAVPTTFDAGTRRVTDALDLAGLGQARLLFRSWLSPRASSGAVEVSADAGANWLTVGEVLPADAWADVAIEPGGVGRPHARGAVRVRS